MQIFYAVTSKSVFHWPRDRQFCGLLAAVVWASAILFSASADTPSTQIFGPPVMPMPAHVNARDLPRVFFKEAPASLADLREIENRVAEIVSNVTPAVVAVEIDNSSGSGVVISADGLVLTAGHVGVKMGRQVTFKFPDGKTAHGRTVGVDADVDTGFDEGITDPGPWPHVSVGELSHTHVGDWALALGHPGGSDPAVRSWCDWAASFK